MQNFVKAFHQLSFKKKKKEAKGPENNSKKSSSSSSNNLSMSPKEPATSSVHATALQHQVERVAHERPPGKASSYPLCLPPGRPQASPCVEQGVSQETLDREAQKCASNGEAIVAPSPPVKTFDPSLLVPINTNPHGLFIHHFEIHRTLGTGSFGRVHLVKYLGNSDYYAMKVLNKIKIAEMKQIDHTINERNILSRINHPFIVTLLCTFQDSQNLYMIMDYVVGGELFSILRRAQKFPNDIAKFYAAEVILAFEYMHKMNLIYRDLKPENILINKDGHIKMTDFGFAKYVPDVTKTLCGTPEYLAPEIIASRQYSKSVDWYSLGILIFEMLAGFPPFYNDNHLVLYEAVLLGNIKFPAHFDVWAVDIIRKLTTTDVTKRYGNLMGGTDDIKNHPWFSGVDWDKLYEKKIRPPYVPKVSNNGDTRHFEFYPEDQGVYGICNLPDPYYEFFRDF